MLRIRLIEEGIAGRYHLDEMKTPVHLVIGQEATTVGCSAALRHDDLVYASHRTHGAFLAKGGDLRRMLCELYCRANGTSGSRSGSMYLIDPSAGVAGGSAIVGGAVPIAVGAALAAQTLGRDTITVVYFGEAATEEGVTSESLNFAALKRLPVVFLCENNFYSSQSPLSTRQAPRDIAAWAAAHGVRSVRADGMNVLAVHDAVDAAVRAARSGNGPSFIEAPVYRFRAHGGATDDSESGYRDVDEREAWERVCPIEMFFSWLVSAGLLDKAGRERMRRDIAAEIDDAFAFAIASPQPLERDLHTHVYAD